MSERSEEKRKVKKLTAVPCTDSEKHRREKKTSRALMKARDAVFDHQSVNSGVE